MEAVITDPYFVSRLIAERQESGVDRFDEVWDGTYVVAPIADDTHQDIQASLGTIAVNVIGWGSPAHAYMGVNVSDRVEGWQENYRWPDVAVYLADTSARDRKSHWCGGPDFAVEIRSHGDRALQKIPFYSSVKTRELLIVDGDPWSLELYRLREDKLVSTGKIELGTAATVDSEILPLSFGLIAGRDRPIIEVRHLQTGQTWPV